MSKAGASDFVPEEFQIPATLEHVLFRLRMLSAADVHADYDAVMASQARLRAGSPHGWPRNGFTLAENLADLQRHEQEFHDRVAFAYTMTPVETGAGTELDGSAAAPDVLGCVYINPPSGSAGSAGSDEQGEHDEHDAEVYMWVRDEHHPDLTGPLFQAVDAWLKAVWPFSAVHYIRQAYYLPDERVA